MTLAWRLSARSATRREREARESLSPRAVRRDGRSASPSPQGHRIIARRYKTPVGEIDLVALKGKRLAFVEVKQRKSFEDAGWSLPTRAAAHRQGRAIWLAGHPDYAGHDLAFDVVLAAPWAMPRYIENAFPV
jgi:putative endonuclease